jgi:hypothetical protein
VSCMVGRHAKNSHSFQIPSRESESPIGGIKP